MLNAKNTPRSDLAKRAKKIIEELTTELWYSLNLNITVMELIDGYPEREEVLNMLIDMCKKGRKAE